MIASQYINSELHLKNISAARVLALLSNKLKTESDISSYNKQPSLCGNCGIPLSYEKKKNKFCSTSCSASYTNKKRLPRTEESKSKTSNAVILKYSMLSIEEKHIRNMNHRGGRVKSPDVEFTCPQCNKTKIIGYSSRNMKTCGDNECRTAARFSGRAYHNGSRKSITFFNPYENKEVVLESSWEVETANLLIANNIKWIRPKYIKWIDGNGKGRCYYPDFYLPDFNVYLDPKNPYCMAKDVEKMSIVSKEVHVVFGELQLIKDYILSLG